MTSTWRYYLDILCRNMSAVEKEHFVHAIGISKTTLNRWRRGADNPNKQNLERMLGVFAPEQREQFLMLLRRDTKLWELIPIQIQKEYSLETHSGQLQENSSFQLGLLDAFALKTLRLQRDTPDRFWQVSGAVMAKCLTTLETHPKQTGMEIVIAKCMPPKEGKVRSLRLLVSMGTPPWRSDQHFTNYFVGGESLVGLAIARRHGEVIHDCTNHSQSSVSLQRDEHEQSTAAYPIMRDNSVAGALLVSSTQRDYFSPEHLELLEIFADLIRLAFYDVDFYHINDIDLGLMPPPAFQQAHFENFGHRVESAYRRAIQNEWPLRDLTDIEDLIRGQIEEELLAIGMKSMVN